MVVIHTHIIDFSSAVNMRKFWYYRPYMGTKNHNTQDLCVLQYLENIWKIKPREHGPGDQKWQNICCKGRKSLNRK